MSIRSSRSVLEEKWIVESTILCISPRYIFVMASETIIITRSLHENYCCIRNCRKCDLRASQLYFFFFWKVNETTARLSFTLICISWLRGKWSVAASSSDHHTFGNCAAKSGIRLHFVCNLKIRESIFPQRGGKKREREERPRVEGVFILYMRVESSSRVIKKKSNSLISPASSSVPKTRNNGKCNFREGGFALRAA